MEADGDADADRGRSRLGCQVYLTKDIDGLVAKLPSATRNMYVDGKLRLLFIRQKVRSQKEMAYQV